MMRIFLLVLVPYLVLAQDYASQIVSYTVETANPTYTAATTSGQPMTHTVDVAKGSFTFKPEITYAAIGDIIEFNFFPPNHSVIRAEYEYPCMPYEDLPGNGPGFFSGFKPVDVNSPDPPKWSLRINDSYPVFFYCGAEGSCKGHQMVGVINPNSTTSLDVQKRLAANSSYTLLPGEPVPAEGENPSLSTATTSSVIPTHTQSAASSTTTAASVSSHGHSGLGPGPIAGIAIGGAAVVLIAAGFLYMCGRHSRKNNAQAPVHNQDSYTPVSQPAYYDQNKHVSMISSQYSPNLPSYMSHYDPGTFSSATSNHGAVELSNGSGSEYSSPNKLSNLGYTSPPYDTSQYPHAMRAELPTEYTR